MQSAVCDVWACGGCPVGVSIDSQYSGCMNTANLKATAQSVTRHTTQQHAETDTYVARPTPLTFAALTACGVACKEEEFEDT